MSWALRCLAMPDKLALLEASSIPAVAAMRAAFLRENAQAPLVVLDIPLLYEKTATQRLWMRWSVVSAPADVASVQGAGQTGYDEGEIRAEFWRFRYPTPKSAPALIS